MGSLTLDQFIEYSQQLISARPDTVSYTCSIPFRKDPTESKDPIARPEILTHSHFYFISLDSYYHHIHTQTYPPPQKPRKSVQRTQGIALHPQITDPRQDL